MDGSMIAGNGEPAVNRTSCTVAIVDDDQSTRKALSRLLRVHGMMEETFPSAMDLMADGRLERWDCLIVDVRMPGIGGLELTAQLRRQGWDTPVILISAFDDPEARAKAREVGAVAFLLKPFDQKCLFKVVERVVA